MLRKRGRGEGRRAIKRRQYSKVAHRPVSDWGCKSWDRTERNSVTQNANYDKPHLHLRGRCSMYNSWLSEMSQIEHWKCWQGFGKYCSCHLEDKPPSTYSSWDGTWNVANISKFDADHPRNQILSTARPQVSRNRVGPGMSRIWNTNYTTVKQRILYRKPPVTNIH